VKPIDEAFSRLMSAEDGYKKVAACMIPPIRRVLKQAYDLEMTKDQECRVEAEVYTRSVLGLSSSFDYREAVKLQEELISQFKMELSDEKTK